MDSFHVQLRVIPGLNLKTSHRLILGPILENQNLIIKSSKFVITSS